MLLCGIFIFLPVVAICVVADSALFHCPELQTLMRDRIFQFTTFPAGQHIANVCPDWAVAHTRFTLRIDFKDTRFSSPISPPGANKFRSLTCIPKTGSSLLVGVINIDADQLGHQKDQSIFFYPIKGRDVTR